MQQGPFADVVRYQLDKRGLSVERLAHAAWDPEVPGTSPAMVRKALRGERALTIPLMSAVADALGVDPESFEEYRLAGLRRLLDPREVGLAPALETYDRVTTAAPDLVDAGAAAAAHLVEEMERAAQQDPDASSREATPPPPAAPAKAPASSPRPRRKRAAS